MAKDEKEPKAMPPSEAARADRLMPEAPTPGWATGLRSLYDAVVDEPLPASFLELLAKLDKAPE